MGRPAVIVITGLPGSGKTTLARHLAHYLRLPLFARDEFRTGLFFTAGGWTDSPGPVPSVEESIDAFFEVVSRCLGLGVSCVVDFVLRSDRPDDLVRLAEAQVIVVEVASADADRRYAERQRGDPLLTRPAVLAALGVADIDEYIEKALPGNSELARYTDLSGSPLLRMNVDTTDGYRPSFDSIVSFVTSAIS